MTRKLQTIWHWSLALFALAVACVFSYRQGRLDGMSEPAQPTTWTQDSFDRRLAKCVNSAAYSEPVCRNIVRADCVETVPEWKSCYGLAGEAVPDFQSTASNSKVTK